MDLPELDVVFLRLDVVFLLLDLITGNKLVKYGRFLNISCKKAIHIVEPIKQELKLMAVRTSTGTILYYCVTGSDESSRKPKIMMNFCQILFICA